MSSTHPPATDVAPAPTAWQSLPTLIRFAVWVWAIGTVATLAVGWLIVAVMFGLG